MGLELILIVVAVGSVAGASAFFANLQWPQRTVGELTARVASWLALGIVFLTVAGCILVQSTDCAPEDTVCDGPAMAAMGIVLLGSMTVMAIVLVGAPVAYTVLKMLRRK